MAKKKKFYVVWKGHTIGIFTSWESCQQQIKNHSKAQYKSFNTEKEAISAFQKGYSAYKNNLKPIKNSSNPTLFKTSIIQKSLSVDAACAGNPGIMEYQGVWTGDKTQVFHQKFALGTNNIGEFLAIVHGVSFLNRLGDFTTPIYTDSKIAMGWVKKGHCKTTLKREIATEKLFSLIDRAELWLAKNTIKNPVLKWETKSWGEIPADFGRK